MVKKWLGATRRPCFGKQPVSGELPAGSSSKSEGIGGFAGVLSARQGICGQPFVNGALTQAADGGGLWHAANVVDSGSQCAHAGPHEVNLNWQFILCGN